MARVSAGRQNSEARQRGAWRRSTHNTLHSCSTPGACAAGQSKSGAIKRKKMSCKEGRDSGTELIDGNALIGCFGGTGGPSLCLPANTACPELALHVAAGRGAGLLDGQIARGWQGVNSCRQCWISCKTNTKYSVGWAWLQKEGAHLQPRHKHHPSNIALCLHCCRLTAHNPAAVTLPPAGYIFYNRAPTH